MGTEDQRRMLKTLADEAIFREVFEGRDCEIALIDQTTVHLVKVIRIMAAGVFVQQWETATNKAFRLYSWAAIESIQVVHDKKVES